MWIRMIYSCLFVYFLKILYTGGIVSVEGWDRNEDNKSKGIVCYFTITEKEYLSEIIIYVYFCYIASNDLLLCMVLSSKQ